MANMWFGPLGRQVSIPYPLSGMSIEGESESEETGLLSGGLNVYRAPTTRKAYNMSYRGGVAGLQPLVDMHAGMYGRGPFYMVDPLASAGNLLPTRWASPWQLGHIANGWCDPVLVTQSVTPEGQYVRFTGNAAYTNEGLKIAVPVTPGQPLYLKAWGARTGTTAVVRVHRLVIATGLWELAYSHVPTLTNDLPLTIHNAADSTLYSAYKLELYVPPNNSLSLYHIDLGSVPYKLQVLRTNMQTSPRPTSTTGFTSTGGAGAYAFLTDEAEAYTRFTKDATTATTALYYGASINVTSGAPLSFRFWVRSSYTATLQLRNNATLIPGETRALSAGVWTEVVLENHVPSVSTFRLAYVVTSMQAGATFDHKKAIVEQSATSPSYFDGDTTPPQGTVYAWTGTANASTSTETVTTYQPTVFRSGQGAGALQFTGNISGDIVSTVVGRIGLSVDLKEVERDPNL